jgi:hypothetical protein
MTEAFATLDRRHCFIPTIPPRRRADVTVWAFDVDRRMELFSNVIVNLRHFKREALDVSLNGI